MRVKRLITPIALAVAVLTGQSAMSALDDRAHNADVISDPLTQIHHQINLMDQQSVELTASLDLVPSSAVEGPKVFDDFEVDTKELQVASLEVEESIIGALENIDGQFRTSIPSGALSRSFIDSLPSAQGDEEFACLAQALYFEARGESLDGQQAVAEVILNRVQSSRYPNTICGVVHQGTGRKHACQFSYTCDGNPDTIREHGAYERVAKLARLMIDGLYDQRKLTSGALFYHTTAVHPSWANKMTPTGRYGVHIFYR